MSPYMCILRPCLAAALMGSTVCSVGFAGEDRVSPGPGTAVPATPPRISPPPDPFALEFPKTAEPDRAQREAFSADSWSVAVLQSDLQRATEDAIVLDDALMLLNYDQAGHWVPELLVKLAKHPWQRPGNASTRDFLAQLDRQAQTRTDRAKQRLDQIQQQRPRLVSYPWPFDWRTRRDAWLTLVELMLETTFGEDVIARWREAAAMQEGMAELCRMAHLFSVREAKTGQLDYAFVKPLLDPTPPGPDRIRWNAETLTTLLATGVDENESARVEVRRDLLDGLRADFLDVPAKFDQTRSLGELYRMARERKAPEADLLLETMLTHRQYGYFDAFAREARLPATARRQLLLAKPIRFPSTCKMLTDRLRFLAEQTALPVWIDEEVLEEGRELPIAAEDGPWLATVEKMLCGTEYRLCLLDRDLFWIGHPNRLGAARRAYQDGLGKVTWASKRTAEALSDDTRMEFIAPLNQALEYLSDLHDVQIISLVDDDTPVTFQVRGWPLHLALTAITQRLHCDWYADREVIFVGRSDTLSRIEQNILPGLRRRARLGIAASDLTHALHSGASGAFVDTPLTQVADFLSQQHRVLIRVAEPNRQDLLTLTCKGVTLEQWLDVACLKLGLVWDTDGKSIVIGDAPR